MEKEVLILKKMKGEIIFHLMLMMAKGLRKMKMSITT